MIKYSKLFFIIFMFVSPGIFSQTILLPGEEAPESIFSTGLGDADVDLFLTGSWETELRGGYAFTWNSIDKDIKESSFPGMTSGFQPIHKPDILISLWLLNSYFFEASFIDDYELNTILFGYEAVEEDFLRSVRIGNTDIGFGDYSYLQIPKASTDSLGGMALFKNDKSEHQLMIRFDPAEMQAKNFIGKNEVDPVRVKLTDYIEGRYFILPDVNVNNLVVYIEDSSGIYSDGTHQYRPADSDDAIISAEEGIVFFREPLSVRAAVHYTKGGLPVGDGTLGIGSLAKDSDGLVGSTGMLDITGTDQFQFGTADEYLGIDMDLWALSIDSKTTLLLYEPGVFSPFEMLSIYSIPYTIPTDFSLFKALLADINLSTGENISISTVFEDNTVRVLYSGDSYRNPANRYPLAESIDADVIIYEPDKQLSGSPPDKELLFQRLFPIGSYYLGDNVLDGSVAVTVNGFDEYRYTFNSDSGVVNFMFPVPADAQIEIRYRTMAKAGLSGDLMVGLGSKFDFSEKLFLETGAGLRWNVLDSEYTEKPGDASGSILGTAGLSYTGDYLDFRLDAGISVHNPNTTGILRLTGMNRSGFSVPLSANLLYPSAIPGSDIIEPHNAANRGELLYKNYYEYDASGASTLQRYDWPGIPSAQIWDYDTGSRIGPYIADAGTEIDGDVAVFDYDLAANEWVGGRIPVTLGAESLDLSSTQSISLQWKNIDSAGSIKIYLRVGKLAEDLDNDSLLDKEISVYDTGFTFNDSQSAAKKIGLSSDGLSNNNQIDTEDLDGNSILDGEGSNLILTKTEVTDFIAPGASWETLTLNLKSSDREMLKVVTGFEIIIIEDASSPASGRLLVGDITFSGSSFVTKPAVSQTVTASEINELYSTAPTPLLITSHPEADIFSSGTGAQNVVEMAWNALGTWQATTFTEAADLSNYNKITFYMKTPDSDPADITFSLTNPSGEGITLNFLPNSGSPNWVKYTVDYRNGSLTADDISVSGVTWSKRDFNAINVNRLSLIANCTIGPGTLLLDEVHLEDPIVGISGAASTKFNYTKTGTIFDYKGTPVLSNLNFSNSSSVTGRNFASGFSNNSDSTIYTASDLSISLLAMRINGNLDLQWQDTQLYSSPGVSFTIPFLDNRLVLNDSYSEVNMPLAETVSRENSITAKLGISSVKLQGGSVYNSQNLIRNWGISSNTVWEKGSRLSTSIDLSMISEENPYQSKDFLEKIGSSYTLFLPGDVHNDRTANININPIFTFPTSSIGINESLGSNISGLDERILSTSQILAIDAEFTLNAESLRQLTIIPRYKKSISSQKDANTDKNFFTDTGASILQLGTQVYYFAGIPLWEIFYPYFGNQFSNNTAGLRNAEYEPEFSLQFSRLTGSRWLDILLPSSVNFNVSRNLNRDFDSVTDQLNVNLETRATALNVFGNLGSRPLFNWYQTEEITNILSIGGEFKSNMEVLNDPDFNLNFKSYWEEYLYDPIINLGYTLYLNFSINQHNSIDLESRHNWSWEPYNWNSSTSGSYNWEVTPDNPIKIPILYDENEEIDSYFEHSEKLTISTTARDEQNEFSLTLTANHTTNLIITDTGNISLFAGIGFDQKNITAGSVITKYYLIGIEAGISAKLTF